MTWTPSKRTLLAGMAALPVAGLLPVAARAEIEVNVNRGDVQPLPIAIPAFAGPQGPDIAGVISADLQRSGLFRPLDPASFIEHDLNIAYEPNYASWRQINAQALIVGQATPANGSLQVGFHLFDVPAGKELGFGGQSQGGLQLSASAENWRRIAHKIADAVYERLTGEKGYFDTRVVFVAGGRGGTRRLAIMDQDGANPSYLPTEGSAIVMTPRYSSNSQEITYMTLRAEGSSVYLLNLDTTRSESLGDFKGMVFAPRFSPDGGKVAFSVERGGNSDIFVMDLRNRQTVRLTADPAIDTSPSFSPDGTQIVFNSDRSGSPQLYIMGADGSNPRRISFGQGGRYTTPVWSPTGEFIAFTRQNGGEFRIGVMKPDGSEERLLTAGFHDEGPTWAPNGRVLMFERDSGAASKLWTVDVTGRVLQPVPYPGAASDPAWSPLLN